MNKPAEFLRREREALIGYVRRRIDDTAEQDAEDIVQDVILGLFDRADPAIPVQNLAAYIYQALRNRIVDVFRKRRDTSDLSDSDVAAPAADDPLRTTETKEMMDGVFRAMEDLTPGDRDIIVATEFEGRAFKDLADEWGVPLGTLLARKSRALEKIRHQLTGRFEPL